MPDNYYLAFLKKQGQWLIANRGSAEFALFREGRSAKKALRELQEGKARFCDCGQWVLYSGGLSGHECEYDGEL